ncbi:MAG: SurA N-terminal domain-containing protein [Deltaproteobacteria bacterium]|nr:SurA N-terminal domain-containing protein [Deltaproteobacteria bacterium]
MLGLMRRHSRSIFIKLIYVGLILSFVVWGIGTYQSRDSFIAARVDGEEISMSEYQRTFDNMLNSLKENMKENFKEEMIEAFNLKKQAMDSLINNILLRKEAKRLSLRAEDNEIQGRIDSYPAFQKDGRFDKATYRLVLKNNRLKPADFEEEQRRLILMWKAESAIKNSAAVTDDEVLASFVEQKETVSLDYIKVSPDKFKGRVKPSSAEVQEYFAANMGEFTIPERVKMGYALFKPEDFVKKIKLTPEEYEDYYNSYIDDFTIPGEVRASHILLKFNDNREEAKAKAGELLEGIKGGEDFAALAAEHSEDPLSAGKGGDLGFFGPGDMVKDFEEAAYALEKGAVSEVVESVYGYHIIKVTDIKEEKVTPLAEVKGKIRKVLESEISRELAESMAEDIYYEALRGKNLEELVKEEKIPFKTTGFFNLDNIPAQFDPLREVVLSANAEAPGWVSRPREAEGKFYILTLINKEAPREPRLEEVKAAVTAAVKEKKAREVAAALGEKLLEGIKKGLDLKKTASNNGLKLESTDHFSRVAHSIPGIGVSQEIVVDVFQLSSEKSISEKTYNVGNNIFVVGLKEKKDADPAEYEKERESFRSRLLEQRRDEVFRRWLDEARKNADIIYNEDLADLKG